MIYYDKLWKDGPTLARSEDSFSLSTDSVVLSHFINVKPPKRIIDLGCGAGVLTVLLATKYPRADLVGLEIQEQSAYLSGLSITASETDNVKIICGDMREHKGLFASGEFDLVVSNPPYFPVDAGYSAASESRRIARQEVCCKLDDLFKSAGYLCRFGGAFYLVHKPNRLAEIFIACTRYGFEPKRIRTVHHYAKNAPSLVLVECRRGAKAGLIYEPPLVLCNDDGTDSDEAKIIYHKTDYTQTTP